MNGWFLVGKLVGKYTSPMDSIESHDPFFKSYRKKNQSGQSKKVQLCVSDSVVSKKSVLILFLKRYLEKITTSWQILPENLKLSSWISENLGHNMWFLLQMGGSTTT